MNAEQLKDRDRVVARIEPVVAPSEEGTEDAQLARLASQGILRRGPAKISDIDFSGRPRLKQGLVEALLADREEGY